MLHTCKSTSTAHLDLFMHVLQMNITVKVEKAVSHVDDHGVSVGLLSCASHSWLTDLQIHSFIAQKPKINNASGRHRIHHGRQGWHIEGIPLARYWPISLDQSKRSRRMRALFATLTPLVLLPALCSALTLPTHPSLSCKGPHSRRHDAAKIVLQARGGDDNNDAPSRIPSVSSVTKSISYGYRARVAADPNFLIKSFLEVALAAGTQMMAEVSRRGAKGCITEIDFVVAGVLTAIAGKYYSSWRVAPTATPDGDGDGDETVTSTSVQSGTQKSKDGFWSRVPTNAFQPYHLDGKTRPTVAERFGALLAPIPTLFEPG